MDREKEIKRAIYEKSLEKKKIIKELKMLRDQLLEYQGMQHLEKENQKVRKRK